MSESEQKILDFIKQYKRTHQGTSPSQDEIARGCGLAHRSSAHYHIQALQEQGRIEVLGTRNIVILDPEPEA